jgi:hypothetical protein
MERTVNIDFNSDVVKSHTIYSGLTYDEINEIVFNDITDTCSFIIDNTEIINDFIFVKITCKNCNDQIYKINI